MGKWNPRDEEEEEESSGEVDEKSTWCSCSSVMMMILILMPPFPFPFPLSLSFLFPFPFSKVATPFDSFHSYHYSICLYMSFHSFSFFFFFSSVIVCLSLHFFLFFFYNMFLSTRFSCMVTFKGLHLYFSCQNKFFLINWWWILFDTLYHQQYIKHFHVWLYSKGCIYFNFFICNTWLFLLLFWSNNAQWVHMEVHLGNLMSKYRHLELTTFKVQKP